MWSVRACALCFSRGDLSYRRPQYREACAKRFSLARALLRHCASPHRIRCFHHFETWRAHYVSRLDTMVGAAAHWGDARLRDRSTGKSLAAPICGGAIRGDRRSDVDPRRLELGAISKADCARYHHFQRRCPRDHAPTANVCSGRRRDSIVSVALFPVPRFQRVFKGKEKLMLSILANGILNRFIDLAL